MHTLIELRIILRAAFEVFILENKVKVLQGYVEVP